VGAGHFPAGHWQKQYQRRSTRRLGVLTTASDVAERRIGIAMTGSTQHSTTTMQGFRKPRIHLLATGGTIAGTQAQADGLGYRAGSIPFTTLLQAVPQVDALASLSGEQFCNIGSQDMDEALWLGLARRTAAVLDDAEIDGVVITHGTDTMEETAYFLSLTVPSDKPVILVGAMRPATASDADGPANLADAIQVAVAPAAKGRGTLVVMHGRIHAARAVEKRDNGRLDAFASRTGEHLGVVNALGVTFLSPAKERSTNSCPFQLTELGEVLPRVAIIYAYAGLDRGLIDAAVTMQAAGIVLAGVGSGNAAAGALAALSDAVGRGVVVVRSSRVGGGSVQRNQEVADDRHGFVVAMDLSPQKARILLMLSLTRTRDPISVQRLFLAH
jgi:L-asparaginase